MGQVDASVDDTTHLVQRAQAEAAPPVPPGRSKLVPIALVAAVVLVAAVLGFAVARQVGSSGDVAGTAETSEPSSKAEPQASRSSVGATPSSPSSRATDSSVAPSSPSSSAASVAPMTPSTPAPVVPPTRSTLAAGEATATVNRLYSAWTGRDQATINALVVPQYLAAFDPGFLDNRGIATVSSYSASETASGSVVRVCSRQLFTKTDGATQTESRCFDVALVGGVPTITWTGNQTTDQEFS